MSVRQGFEAVSTYVVVVFLECRFVVEVAHRLFFGPALLVSQKVNSASKVRIVVVLVHLVHGVVSLNLASRGHHLFLLLHLYLEIELLIRIVAKDI